MDILVDLFLTFAKIGLFTFGGGYAMIAMIEDACVENKKWISHDEMMDITVIAESTPGPIAINCATYVGYKKYGILGALAATLGIVLPSFFIIYVVAIFLDNFLEITIIANAFKGIKLAVGILIFDAALKMIKKMKKKLLPVIFMMGAASIMILSNVFAVKISSILIMLAAGVISIAVFTLGKQEVKK